MKLLVFEVITWNYIQMQWRDINMFFTKLLLLPGIMLY